MIDKIYKAPRKQKKEKIVFAYLTVDENNLLEDYCNKFGIKKSYLITNLTMDYLNNYFKGEKNEN